jgi:hypothetical protein
VRQPRNYGALHETHRQVDEQQTPPAETPERAAHRPNYRELHQTQYQVDVQAAEERRAALNPQRRWAHHGGLVPQQHSALIWNKQDIEIRMAQDNNSGAARGGQGTEQGPNDPELQEARAAVEEARRREAAERARQQERDRGGPER